MLIRKTIWRENYHSVLQISAILSGRLVSGKVFIAHSDDDQKTSFEIGKRVNVVRLKIEIMNGMAYLPQSPHVSVSRWTITNLIETFDKSLSEIKNSSLNIWIGMEKMPLNYLSKLFCYMLGICKIFLKSGGGFLIKVDIRTLYLINLLLVHWK